MKIIHQHLIIILALCTIIHPNVISGQYNYDTKIASENKAKLLKYSDQYLTPYLKDQSNLNTAADIVSKIYAINPNQMPKMAANAIMALKKQEVISEKELNILSKIFNSSKITEQDYINFHNHNDFSSASARSLFENMQAVTPPYTAQGGGRWKRIKKWISDHFVYAIVAVSGAFFVTHWMKNIDRFPGNNTSPYTGSGFMARSHGRGCDGSLPAGWPF